MNGESAKHDKPTIDEEPETGRQSGDALAEEEASASGSVQSTTDDPDPYRQDDFAYVDENGTGHTPTDAVPGQFAPRPPDIELFWRVLFLIVLYIGSLVVGYSYVVFGLNLLFYLQAQRQQRDGLVVSGIGLLRMMLVIAGLLLLTYFFLVGFLNNLVGNIYEGPVLF